MKKIKGILSPYLGLSRVVYVIFFSRLINAMGCFVGPLMTLILTEKIGLPSTEAGIILTISSCLMFAPMLIGGKLADVLGRKRTIIMFDMLAVITYFLCGFMEPSMTLVVMMMFASACFSTATPAHDALLADISNAENRQVIYSMSYMGWNLGFAIGAAVAGFLYENYLNLIFIGDALTGFLSLLLILTFVKDVKIDDVQLLPQTEDHQTSSIFSVLLHRPKLLIFALLMIGVNFAYAQFNFLIPLHVANVFGADSGARYFGLMSSLNGCIVIAMTPVITILLKKMKPIQAISLGGFIYTLSFGILGFIETIFIFFFSIFVMTLGEIILSINVSPYIMNQTPASHRGRMIGTLQLIMGAGYAIAPLIMGKVISIGSISLGWIIVGITACLCSIGILGISFKGKEIQVKSISN